MWNQAHPDMTVKPGDHVMAVNGHEGDAASMYQACRDDNTLEMKIGQVPESRRRGKEESKAEVKLEVKEEIKEEWDDKKQCKVAVKNEVKEEVKDEIKEEWEGTECKMEVKDEVEEERFKREFTIVLEKQDNVSLGFTVDIGNSVSMVVLTVVDGLLAMWNQAHPDMEVKPGDHVMRVNGHEGDAASMYQACRDDNTLEMEIGQVPESRRRGKEESKAEVKLEVKEEIKEEWDDKKQCK